MPRLYLLEPLSVKALCGVGGQKGLQEAVAEAFDEILVNKQKTLV